MTFHHKAQNAEQRASRAQHAMPCAKMSSPSCTSGEKRELNEQLVANVAPALQSLQQESQAAAKRHEALSAVTMAYMKLQVEALGKMNEKLDSHETRLQKVEERQKQADEHVARLKKLEKHQKQADDHEVRLKKLETLLIPKQRRVPSPPGERAFAQAAARASSKVHVRGPREPDGWCRLSVPVRKLLRSAAFARLKFSRVFHGALGTKLLTSRPFTCFSRHISALSACRCLCPRLPRILYTRSLLLFICC